jgi:hypothetical protein
MATIGVFVVGGVLFGVGIGTIVGYLLGRRHGLHAARRGFPVDSPSAGR